MENSHDEKKEHKRTYMEIIVCNSGGLSPPHGSVGAWGMLGK